MEAQRLEPPTSVIVSSKPVEILVLGFNVAARPQWFQLSFCGCCVFFGFLINGVCEEFVFKQLNFNYPWYFTMAQSLVYLIIAYANGFRLSQRRTKWMAYWWLSLPLVGSVGLTKAALQYINYPAQIIFKSCKVIPVMLLGSCFAGMRRTYGALEYLSAAILVVGLIIFTLADVSVTPTFEATGVVMIVGSLVFDAFLGNLQEAMFSADAHLSQQEVLFCSTAMGLVFILPPLLLTGELGPAWKSGIEYPMVYPITVVAAMATYIGQLGILSLIYLFGAATTYVVTSLRKVVTLALSYIIFTKPFSHLHLLGFLLITASLSMKAIKNPGEKETKIKGDTTPTDMTPATSYDRLPTQENEEA
eukprot:TRINITY_DN2652_c1_g1_i1.p1 TRINITY_DN2652_c1_g1~~TRINITY_DN2652_c1_g1_i1.p1  ORF type:complete len:361 (-),score=44.54 TRINITY_DN2652_c1_g1_i1:290-1372(-)